MSKEEEEEYTTIEINTSALSEAKQLLMLSIMNEGMLRERERILALLEETRDCKSQWDYEVRIGEIIAKIKGENK